MFIHMSKYNKQLFNKPTLIFVSRIWPVFISSSHYSLQTKSLNLQQK